MKTIKLRYILPMVTLLFGMVAFAMPTPAPAKAAVVIPDPDKVTICHRSDSASNPYQHNSVAKSSVNGGGADDHSSHTGPIAYSQAYAQQLKDAKPKVDWGDIIPPFDAYPGLNWTTLGQAMWNNNCNFVTAVVPAAVTFVNPTCQALGSYTIPTTANVVYKISNVIVPAGTYPAVTGSTVTVTAFPATTDYYFADGTITTWSNTFTAPDCNVTPAAVTFTAPTCSVLGTYVVPTTANATYKLGANTVAAGSYNASNGSTVKIDAAVNAGYAFAAGATTTWSNTFTAPTNCTGTLGSSTTTTTTSTPQVAGTSTQVTSVPAGAVDAGAGNGALASIAGIVFSIGMIGSSVLLKQRAN